MPQDGLVMMTRVEFEAARRRQIKRKTDEVMARLLAQRLRRGTIPYGYRLEGDKKLVEDEKEQEGLALIIEMRAAGYGRRLIAAALNETKIPAKKGGLWKPQSVGRIVKRLEENTL